MSNSEADIPQDTASDVIGNSRPSPGDAGQLQDEASPLASTTQDPNAKNRAQPPKNERTSKMTTYRPTRTSSAPPDEHFNNDVHKSHFQPTKTQQSFLSSNDQGRRMPNYNQQSGRPVPTAYNRGGEESGPGSSQGNSAHDSAAGDSPHPASTGGDNSIPSSGAPSPHGPQGGPEGPVSIQTSDTRPNHPALAPLSPATRSASGEHSGYQGSSGQNSPVHHGYQNNRGFRQNGPPVHTSNEHPRSPYSQGQSGPPGGFHNNREPYNNRPPSGDYRENNGRGAGRINRRAPQGGSFGGRGPHMNMNHMHEGPMSPQPPMNPRNNYAPNTPPQQQQWVQIDPYTGAQIPMQGPPPPQAGGSPYQPQNASYPAGAPMPPGGRPQGMQGMQGMQPRGPPPPQQQPHQQPMFAPQHAQQQAVQAQQQQQMLQQQQQNMMVQQHFLMHNQAQQQFMPQQMFVPFGMEHLSQEMIMMEMQNQHNLQVQNMQVQGMAGMQNVVRAPNGQLMQVVHNPTQGFPMGVMQPQMQTFPHGAHLQQMHPTHPGHQVQGQQVFIQQEMPGMAYGQQPQLVQIPMHIQQGGAPVPPHMQPGMIPNANFNNYPTAVTGMPHVPPPATGHYNPNMPPQYGPQGNNSNRHHDQGPPNQGPGPRHLQKTSPVPPRDHHNASHGSHGPPATAPLPHAAPNVSANPYVPQGQHQQGQASAGAQGTQSHPPVPAGPPPHPTSAASTAASAAATENTSSTATAASIGSAASVASAYDQNHTQGQTQGQGHGQAQAEKDKEAHKEVPAAVNPYQEPGTTPTQNSTPQPAKQRKVLTYKNKDGTVMDINSLKKDDHSSASAPAVTAVASASATPASAVPGAGSAENEERTAVPAAAKVEKVESVPAPVPAATTVPAETTKPTAMPVSVVTPAVSATTSVAPSPRVSPKTVPSPETVPVKRVEALAVPTVEQQLKDLRIEGPSPVDDEDAGVAAAMSPAIKSADLPVFIGTSTTSSTAATGVPSIASTGSTFEPSFSNTSTPRETPDAPASTPGALGAAPGLTPASRSKKGSKKDFLAKADAASASSELSAYETAPAVSAASAAAQKAAVADLKVSTPRVSSSSKSAAPEPSNVPDSWDDDSELNLSPLITPTEPVSSTSVKESTGGRSLRPGGNKSFNINLHQAVAIIHFSKAEILALRPQDKNIANPLGIAYDNITSGDSNAGPSNPQKQSNWNKGPRGGNDARQQDGGDGWKRDSNLPPAPSSASKHKKQNSNVPMPKKVISNQMELLATETMAILNKITPQTFEKLSQGMLTLNVQNIAQMSKVIELIFEKAVQEQGFANLYAELCAFLNSKATHWAFYEVFRVISGPNEFLNEYFWVRECSFPPVYAGPFFSQTECVAALHGSVLPEMVSLAAALEPVPEAWLLVQPDLLVKVYRNTTTNGYYVTYLPFSQYGEETRSQNTFGDVKMALKDAKNKHYFRAKLVTNCQIEFQQSTMNESVYGELEEERAALLAQRATLSEAEFFYKNADIDDRRLKLKRRMLGNIRFVGELFKQKLLTDVTIQDCISDLMGTPDAWKPMHDEQDIECLCHLLRTAGERLEAKFALSHEALRNFNLHFERLRVLSKDKSLNSRMRFAIEEVLTLRENGWQKRGGGLEGPVKISEIHRKIQEESAAPHHQSSPMQRGGQGQSQNQGPGQGQGGKGAPQRMSILPRPGGGGGRGGGGQGQDARKDDKFGRTQSTSYDAQRDYHNSNNNNNNNTGGHRPQPGEGLRRVHSEYSPPVSGTATPTSTHSSHQGHAPSSSQHGQAQGQGQARGSGGSSAVNVSEMDFSDPKMLNRAKSVITEFLDQRDVAEVKLFFSENGPGVCGYFVLQLIDKYLNATKEPVLSAIKELLKDADLGVVLGSAGAEVVQALRMCETLKCMPDTTMDIKEAPERFAVVLGSLLRCGALADSDVTAIMNEAKVNCIEELGNSDAEWAAVYARFARQLASLA